MAAIINTTYPSYSNVSNYTGVSSAVRSAGVVRNADHHQALMGLERSGGLGLTQYGLVKLPREVLYLQDERSSKVATTRQGDQVVSTSRSDLDEERDLNRVNDRGDSAFRVEAIKARKEKPAEKAENDTTVQTDAQNLKGKEAADQLKKNDVKPDARTDQEFASLIAKAAPEAKSEGSAPAKKRDELKREKPTVVGKPNDVYATLQASLPVVTANVEQHQSLDVLA